MMVSARMNYTGALLATSLAMRPRGAARSAMSGASLPAAKATECGVAGRNSINRPRTFSGRCCVEGVRTGPYAIAGRWFRRH
jgi:hypothetical protein